ncbi:MAG TPA: hypothetical protein V6C85_20290, partial [Allocoleopsis sp.]
IGAMSYRKAIADWLSATVTVHRSNGGIAIHLVTPSFYCIYGNLSLGVLLVNLILTLFTL